MTHFNQLSPAEAERLAILAEECSEVTKACTKILRHGYESFNPLKPVPEDQFPETNRSALEQEIGDLIAIMRKMWHVGDVSEATIDAHADAKPKRMRPYLHHQSDSKPAVPVEREEREKGKP